MNGAYEVMGENLTRSESDLLVFISSVMGGEMTPARGIAVQTVNGIPFFRVWSFEGTPASSEPLPDSYLRKVRESDLVIWLVGSNTTEPVAQEINTCMSAGVNLLVFLLPSESRDDTTKDLLEKVKDAGYAKWHEVKTIEGLVENIEKALSDEVIRGYRDPAAVLRSVKLREMRRLSLSRCKRMWTSLDVSDETANDLAEDLTVGDLLEFPTPGVLRVEGDQGSGKTLAVERLFQRAVDRSLDQSTQPFPLFVRARDLQEPLVEYIDRMSRDCFRPSVQDVAVFIDGLDEIGMTEANRLLDDITAYSDAYPDGTIIVTSRPLPGLKSDVGQRIAMPTLEEQKCTDLTSRIAGRELELHDRHFWSESVQDAIKRPLFAIMLGSVLRDSPDSVFHRPAELVSVLAERSLREVENAEEVDTLLQILAVKAVSGGKRIHPHDVNPRQAKQKMLANSRLVYEQEGTVDFTLPIFREWYAARALIEETVSYEEINSDSDLWTIPLAIAVDSENEAFGYSLMAKLCSSDPGLASLVLRELDPGWSPNGTRDISLTTAVEEGKKIREAMESWSQGLGELYSFIGPTDSQGNTSTLGIKVNADSFGVTVSWYRGARKLPAVIELSKSNDWAPRNPEWSGSSYDLVQNTKLWPWLMTKNHLAYSLSREGFLESLALNSKSDDAVRELSWAFALDVEGKGEFCPYPIGLKRLLEFIEDVEIRSQPVRFGYERTYPLIYVKKIKSHLLNLIESGEDSISDPWPIPEESYSSGLIWDSYSSPTLPDRTNAIYEGALRIYQTVVDQWFRAFGGRFVLYSCLPVRLEGRLKWPPRRGNANFGPTLTWCPRPLSVNENSSAAFAFGDANEIEENFRSGWKDEAPFLVEEFLKVYDFTASNDNGY